MDQGRDISRQNPSISRGQNGRNSRRDNPVDNKDVTNRRKCPDCDGRLSKESTKSKSRVWKKVMWFTRRSKAPKNDICQCQTSDRSIDSNVEDRHSNSWSFTRSASRKFRISSRKRQCKSESCKKSVSVQGKQDEASTSHEGSVSSTHRGSLCSSGANSPTATGSFCDFGASSHAGGKRGSKRHKNTFVLTEIAREINPPVRNDDLRLSNIHHPRKQLTKSSSSVSHLPRSPMIGNVHRSKSFPGSQSCMSPAKRRFTSTPNTAFFTSSPPVKQRCYGLRRTATFCGQLNTEFPKLCMKKSKSVNNGELMKHGTSTSLGEIRDQRGSIVGIVHFYKSPIKMARRVNSINREVKKDCMFEEEECQHPADDQTSSNISQESSGTCLKTKSAIFESQQEAGLLPESFCVNEVSQRNFEETRRDDNSKNCSSFTPVQEISKSIVGAENLFCFLNMNEEIHNECSNQDKSTLCNIEPLVLDIDEPVQELCFDHKDLNSINASASNYIDVNKGEVGVLNVDENHENNHHDTACGYSDTDLLSSMTTQGAVSKYANNIKDIGECQPSSIKDKSLSTPLPSKGEINNISSLETVSKISEDDNSLTGSHHELLTKMPSSVPLTSHQCSESIESENCNGSNSHHENQLQPELNSSLPISEQMSEDGDLPCCLGDNMLNTCQVCDQCHGNNVETEQLSSVSVTLKQTSEDLKSPYQDSDSVSDNCNENLSTTHVGVSPMSQKGMEDFELETKNEIVYNEREHHDFTNTTPKSCGVNLNDTCIENVSLLESEDSFCSDNGSQAKTSTDSSLDDQISVDSSACSEIIEDSANIDDTCESNDINCVEKCLQSEVEITEQLDRLKAHEERDLAICNDAKMSHNCPCVMCEDDLTLEVFDDQFSCNNVAVSNEKFQMHMHSSMIRSSELKPSCPAISENSASEPVDLCNESETNILTSQNWENLRNLAMPVTDREEFKVPCHSSTNSPEVLECSRTSEYVSFGESFSAPQSDVPIHTWKTSETDLKSDEIGLPVPGETFKKRTELMLSWFQEFNDEQRNIILKKILNRCELPQMHLLSVTMENNLHKTCPPNCQDMLVWLPYTVTLKILMYLDPVSLCRCNQVNRAWNELTDNSLLWQRLTRNPDYQLSEASSRRQYQKFTQGNGEIHWKKVFAERFLLQRNWLNGKYKLRTFEGHNQGIACVQFDDTRIVSGSSDKTIKLWDISNTPSELMLTLEGHSGTVRCLDLNGNRLVSGSTDRTIKVWDLSFASYWAGASCKVTMVGHLHTVRCLQADEKKLVSGSYDKTVKVWDLKNGECQLTLRGHTAAVLCVQFDDQKIVSGSYDKKIKVWDLTEGTCLMTLDGHQDAVTCLNLTHDGMKIITGSLDYSLKFWDLSTGKCYGTLDWITSEGHTAVVRCLQVDSWRIVSGGDDKTLKVWELATGQRLLTLRYHSDGVTCMQFNDFAIVSGSYDRTVKLWDFTPKHSYLEAVT